jgi:tyrosyl-tRNA synthetase
VLFRSTTGNALFLSSTPKDFYGGIMSFPDEVIETSFELLTECPLEGLKEKIQKNPMDEKKRLAFEIVKLLWGEESAISSQKEFENTFQNKETPQEINEIEIGDDDTKILSAMVKSKIISSINQAKTLIKQGAVEINGKIISYENLPELKNGDIIKIGKKNFIKIKIKSNLTIQPFSSSQRMLESIQIRYNFYRSQIKSGMTL